MYKYFYPSLYDYTDYTDHYTDFHPYQIINNNNNNTFLQFIFTYI